MDIAPTSTSPSPASARAAAPHRRLAWALVALGSGVPTAVAGTLGADVTIVAAAQLVTTTAVAGWVLRRHDEPQLRGLAGVMLLLTAFLVIGLHGLRAPDGGVTLFTEGPAWRRIAAWQAVSTVISGLLLAIPRLRRSGLLAVGDLRAPAAPIRLINHREPRPWGQLARELAVVLTGVTALTILLGGGFGGTTWTRVVAVLPLAVGFAVVNATNEELQFRVAVLEMATPLLGRTGAAWASALVFGSWHHAGTPGGWAGVALAGFVGWLWARATLETRGVAVAIGLHVLQDIVIFAAVLA